MPSSPSELICPVKQTVSVVSRSVRLAPSDLIMSGMPAGVGPMQVSDSVTGGVEDLADINIRIGARE